MFQEKDGITAVLPFVLYDDEAVIMPVTLAAYLDESERPIAGEPLAVGGFVFRPHAYREFERKWRKMLRTAPGGALPFLHMKDLYAGKKQFERPLTARGVSGCCCRLDNEREQ